MYRIKLTRSIFFNFCLLLFLSFSANNQLHAQVINGSFETVDPGCSQGGPGDCRYVDLGPCTPGWTAFNGSPNNFTSCTSSPFTASQINAFEGERFAGMRYSRERAKLRNEAIFTNVSVPGKSLLTFSHRLFFIGNALPRPVDVQIGMSTTLTPVTSSSGPDPITTSFSGSELLASFPGFSSLTWSQARIVIPTPPSSAQQLAFNPIPTSTPTTSYGGYYAVDDVEIELCDNFAPDYTFVDAMGNPKRVFCYGEDIFVQVSPVNYYYQNIFFDIWDNLTNPDDYYHIGWVPKAGNDLYNLSQLLRDRGAGPINPQGIYSLKMAVNHPDCGWITRIKRFAYTCCGEIDADLNCDIDHNDDDNGVTFTGTAKTDYTADGGSHEICIYTDVDLNGEFELVLCTNDPSIVVDLAGDTRYYITHTVTTPCGTVCMTKTICVGACGGATPIDGCEDITGPECEVPVLDCPTPADGWWGTLLSWTDVGAISYNYEVILNDPECGCKGEVTGFEGNVERNEAVVYLPEGVCYSYRVSAVCEDEVVSPWSAKKCSNDCEDTDEDYDLMGEGRNQEFEKSNGATINTYPSPFESYLNVNVDGLKQEKVELRVVDIMGQLVKSETLTTQNQSFYFKWDAEISLTSGIYLIQIIDGDKVYTQKVIRN